ncbi:MAG: M48 family metalloprotease [Bacteriovorax sp.]
MKNWLKLSVLSLNLLSFGAIACDLHGHSGFMPENNLRIPVGEKAMGGITEVQFNRVMDKMTSLYSSVVASTGRKFAIERRWTDSTVNAYAHQNTPGVDTIVMFGGLARHPETTEDGMALVACHELGHHLGGAPIKADSTWAANEGQADYWGTMKCLRHYFESDDNIAAVKNVNVPTEVVNKCQLIYKNESEIASCERVAMAGLALGRLLNAVMQGKTQVSFTTPDQSVVSQMFDNHPQAQCRLDTYFQASLCDHGLSDAVSKTDANIGVCSLRNGDKIGNRPLCWFKP